MMNGKSGEMPFLDHLEELRHRLLWSIGALVVCMSIAFTVVLRYDVIGLLSAPVQAFIPGGKLVFTHPADPFSISLKIAFLCGLVMAAPVIVYQLWLFLSPALHPHEKRVAIPVIFGATGLFAVGVYLCILWVLPASFDVLFGIQSAALEPMITAREYFSFAISMCLACGAAFQLPIVVGALTALGLVTPATLGKYRRHAVVGSLLAAALITPGDLILMTLLIGVPLYGLYEVSIVLSFFIYRRRMKRERAAAERIGGAEE
jgi:sec-independent protein translocase protein TatC